MKLRTWMLWLMIVSLTVVPLLMARPPTATAMFGGADERARAEIGHIAPGYQPWFTPLFEPQSAEIASLLFALQAAIGAGVIGFWLGMSVAQERARRTTSEVKTPC